MTDLVEQMQVLTKASNLAQAQLVIKTEFDKLDDRGKLLFSRGVMIDQICKIIDKFPDHTQREIIALVTHKYLSRWAEPKEST